MTAPALIGRAAIARHEAERIWADDEDRAAWLVAVLVVPADVEAHLRAFEAAGRR
jgi:hypothetical protein